MTFATEVTSGDRRFLWGLAYRMTGSAADADDIAQEALVRLSVSPPRDSAQPLRPWLVRVTVNLARDALRERRRSYVGPWLPTPVEDAILDAKDAAPDAEQRFADREGALYAFLVALEVLTARERAVLILREVCDLSVREVADALGLGEGNVKVIHHRGTRKLATARPDVARVTQGDAVKFASVERFVAALTAADVATVEALLADDIVLTSDGGGEHFAARVPVVGVSKVAKVYVNVVKQGQRTSRPRAIGYRVINGLPAFVLEFEDARPGLHMNAILFDVGDDGLIRRIFSVSASKKLGSVASAIQETPA